MIDSRVPLRYSHHTCSLLLITTCITEPAASGGVARDLARARTNPGSRNPARDKRGGVFCLWRMIMDFSKLDGLIPAVIQDADSAEVLMVGFMNEEALRLTSETGFATFFSRTRNKLWMKGETSGNRLQVVEMLTDCDDDTVLVKVKRLGDGNVCHTGERSCFFRDARCRPHEAEARHSEGLAAGRDDPAVRARRLQHLRQLALLLPGDRRSRDRVHADSRAGNGALRLGRRPRRRPDRPGLDCRARGRRRHAPACCSRSPI